jgi:hypothetical protein
LLLYREDADLGRQLALTEFTTGLEIHCPNASQLESEGFETFALGFIVVLCPVLEPIYVITEAVVDCFESYTPIHECVQER